ncbi:energy transducer TonB [Hymenobacter negativus]|uniref:TonB family protein n=1 Tax=Hymenobacter negativus TaxID=2795026 RepID=A0ABS0QAT6_9BACT|nr:energy transducer TonB [Hymenobacter negativus]MBH8559331.1 TonB family protein [Hymenobacter negativus]
MADLAAARATAPDGRVCGRFWAAQVLQPRPTLTRRLKWFVVALVLVVGQGLTAHEALAQVRRTTMDYVQQAAKPERERLAATKRDSATFADTNPLPSFGMVGEQMPIFQHGGSNREVIDYIQQRIKWPQENGKIVATEGRLFVSFTVGIDGQVCDAKIVKTFNPRFDEAVLLVVRRLPPFTPGLQNGLPVPVGMTLPITFKLK